MNQFNRFLRRVLCKFVSPKIQLSTRLSRKSSRKNSATASAMALGCALLLSGVSLSVLAKDYIVEVILFENTTQSSVTEPHAYDPPKKPRTKAKAWLLDTQLMLDQAEKLSSAEDYALMHHFAWGQESLPYSKSATYTVIEPDTQGYIKVYADQLLFANIDIDYKGFRMVEKRRLKLNERHFFDHPKFGVLMQVSRLTAAPSDTKANAPVNSD